MYPNTMRQGRRRCGFTLVELLVVVSIIALLIAILLPSLRRARDQAKCVKCVAHARGMAQAAMLFANTHGDRLQLVTDAQGNQEADPSRSKYAYDPEGELLAWPVVLAQMSAKDGYAYNWHWGVRAPDLASALTRAEHMDEDFELALCPADKVKTATPFYPNSGQLRGAGNPDDPQPAGTGLYWGKLSYGINEDMTGSKDQSTTLPPVGRYGPAPRYAWYVGQNSPKAGDRLEGNLARVHDPATLLLIADAGADSMDEATGIDGQANTRVDGVANLIISAKAAGPLLHHMQSTWPQRVPTSRHAKGAVNVVFADFHGETVTPTGWKSASADPRFQVPSGHTSMVRVSPYKMTPPQR